MFRLSRTETIFYIYHVLRVGIIALMLLVLALASQFWQYVGYPRMGFGCFVVVYDAEADCLHTLSPQTVLTHPFEIFLESHQANMAGSACFHQASDSGSLNIQTASLNLSFKPASDILEVNGKEVKKGETFQAVDIWDTNPWVISLTEFKNLGVIPTCERKVGTSMVAIGVYGTEFSFVKGMTTLLALFAGWIGINFRLDMLKSKL